MIGLHDNGFHLVNSSATDGSTAEKAQSLTRDEVAQALVQSDQASMDPVDILIAQGM
ncbi:MAG: hypothetical protein WC791_00705 [Candidatus Paceibacterota bacterium]|jgi:hypothetical protein